MKQIFNYFKTLELKEATKFLVIFYLVGVLGFLIPQSRDIFEMLIPLSLLISIFMLFLFHSNYDRKHLLFFLSVVVLTIAIEAVGTNTGLIFGDYIYGNSLSLKVFGTPILIGFNWLMLTYGTVAIVRSSPRLRRFLPIMVAILMTGYDFVMEPVAMKTDMWDWAGGHVPFQNYVMWFVISAIIGAAYELLNISTKSKTAARIFVLQLAFFGILNLFLS
jgi:putative membrane protein